MSKKFMKKAVSAVLCSAMLFTSLNTDGLRVKAAEEMVPVSIDKVTYQFQFQGVNEAQDVNFDITFSDWDSVSNTVSLEGDGEYTISATPNYGKNGFINLGYFETIENSSITATLEKLTFNDTIEISFEEGAAPVCNIGSDWGNGLKNIWSGLADQEVAYGNNTTALIYDGGKQLIQLKTLQDVEETKEEVVTEKIATLGSLTYHVNVTGVNSEKSLTFRAQAIGWSDYATEISLSGDGSYDFTLTPEKDGLTNIGYFDSIEGSNIKVEWTGLSVNGEYEFMFEENPVAIISSTELNGFYNIWNTKEGTVLASCEGAYLAFQTSADGIALYVETTMSSTGMKTTRSQDYINAMGQSWNLGNSFESWDNTATDGLFGGECAWGNIKTTKELIQAVKAKGYDSIRMPITMYGRWEENKEGSPYTYTIKEEWLERYKEVVDMAVAEDMHVVIDLHGDHYIWLDAWDGNKESVEYTRFVELWEQIAIYFAEESDLVSFETINEPDFHATGTISGQDKLDMVNQAAYDAIRAVSGNENRMIIVPTMNTNDEKGEPTYQFICSLQDENIIATVHYYSAWVYSANLGITGFDEQLWEQSGYDCYSARAAAKEAFERVYQQFTTHGIGVYVGEYGVLGYDAGEQCNELGEELKYYEYVNQLAREYGFCLSFWDNGSGIDRNTLGWKKASVGEMLEACNAGSRSSYCKDLDNVFFKENVSEDVSLPLVLNGNTFTGIEGLQNGVDYTYDEANSTVILYKDFINTKMNEKDSTGIFTALRLNFSDGAPWTESLIKYSAPVYYSANGTKENGITIPADFNGSIVRRATAFAGEKAEGTRLGPNASWWAYLQFDGCFSANYRENIFKIYQSFFTDESVAGYEGNITFLIEYYDGAKETITINKSGEVITFTGAEKEEITTEIPTSLGNWVSGNYSMYKPEITENKERISLKDALLLEAGKTYEAQISNNAFTVIVREVVDGKINTIYLNNKSRLEAKENASYYISVYTASSSYTYMTFEKYKELMMAGTNALEIALLDVTEAAKEEVTEIKASLGIGQDNQWVSGNYGMSKPVLSENFGRISLKEALSVTAGEKVTAKITLNGCSLKEYRMIAREVSKETGKVVNTIYLYDGDSFVPKEDMDYYVTLYCVTSKSKTLDFQEYAKLMNEDMVVDLCK